ncbi:MAG TPA: HlyD family efflux transporter periplasmic adaptor subunit [Gammaproteobacteria bacterium]|nr:HlyD family efflux transporter periplasmic adaptor subunit [Gammaproteobacteria bacterium]
MAITASKSNVVKGGIALLVVYAGFSFLGSGKEDIEDAVFQEPVVARADQGSFDISIIESGILNARRSVTLASDLPSNRAKIIFLRQEGATVKPGEVIVKFDPAPFAEDIEKLSAEISDASAALAQAEEELQLTIQQGRASTESMLHNVEVAQLKHKNLTQAELPLRLTKSKNDLQAAEQNYRLAKKKAKSMKELLEQGFTKRREYEQAKAAISKAIAELSLAKQQEKLLREMIAPGEIRQSELKLVELKRKVAEQKKVNQHKLALKNAAMIRLDHRYDLLKKSLLSAKALLDKTIIKAPVPGFVVYKTVSVQGEMRKVQVGDSVWQHNGFIVLPDMSEIITDLKVRETDIAQLEVGQTASIRPQAYPNLLLTGRVETIGTLASGKDEEMPRFLVRVAINDVDSRLRPGMTARTRIQTAKLEDVVRVPVEAVFYSGDQAVSFLWKMNKAEAIAIEIGPSDGQFVVVTKGLSGGEKLLLHDPRKVLGGEPAS